MTRDAIHFISLNDYKASSWSKPEALDFLDRLGDAPIADTELLHLSHYCPIVVRRDPDGASVHILLDPSLTASKPLDAKGRWRPSYCPIAMRTLPFWPGESETDIRIAPELAAVNNREPFPVRDDKGRPSKDVSTMVASVRILQRGMRRLDQAASVLLALDLLAPLVVDRPGEPEPQTTNYLTVDVPKFRAMMAQKAVALSLDNCLPLDLAVACMFSRRLTSAHVHVEAPRVSSLIQNIADDQQWTDHLEPFAINLALDTSRLFSFDEWHSAGPSNVTEAARDEAD